MAEPRKVRILMVNDNLGVISQPETFFKNAPVKPEENITVELVIVPDVESARGQLTKWAQESPPARADVITIDLEREFPAKEVVGPFYAQGLQLWAESQDPSIREQVKPGNIFLHSGGQKPKDGFWPFHQTSELNAVLPDFNQGKFSPNALNDHMPHGVSPPVLIHFLNTLGFDYPETREELQRRFLLSGDVEVTALAKQVETGKLTLERALKGVIPDSIQAEPRVDATGHEPLETFARSVGGGATGRLVFDKDQVDNFYAFGQQSILVAGDKEDEALELLYPKNNQPGIKGKPSRRISGVVLLGEGSDHDSYIYRAHQVAAVFDNSEGHLHIEERDGTKVLVRSMPGEEDILFRTGDEISIAENHFYPGLLPVHPPVIRENEEKLAAWADNLCDEHAGLTVKANADSVDEVEESIRHGARGIGLVRTEHIFHQTAAQQLIMSNLLEADTPETFKTALDPFRQTQELLLKEVFKRINNVPNASNFPVTVRLLDAPPKEFLPAEKDDPAPLQHFHARFLKNGIDNTRGLWHAGRSRELYHASLYEAQAEAIFDAAEKAGFQGQLEIMVPLVHNAEELQAIKSEVEAMAEKKGFTGKYAFGAMIETQDAVKNAGEIARICDFLSIGSNDLTAEITGCPRNDGKATKKWMDEHDQTHNPFFVLVEPVKERIAKAVRRARETHPGIRINLCGDQVNTDYASIAFCQELGLDSISVSSSGPLIVKSRILAGKACAAGLEEPAVAETPPGFAARLTTDASESSPVITDEARQTGLNRFGAFRDATRKQLAANYDSSAEKIFHEQKRHENLPSMIELWNMMAQRCDLVLNQDRCKSQTTIEDLEKWLRDIKPALFDADSEVEMDATEHLAEIFADRLLKAYVDGVSESLRISNSPRER